MSDWYENKSRQIRCRGNPCGCPLPLRIHFHCWLCRPQGCMRDSCGGRNPVLGRCHMSLSSGEANPNFMVRGAGDNRHVGFLRKSQSPTLTPAKTLVTVQSRKDLHELFSRCHSQERSDEQSTISPPPGERYREGGLRSSSHQPSLLPRPSPDLTTKNTCTALFIGHCPLPALATTANRREMAQNGAKWRT